MKIKNRNEVLNDVIRHGKKQPKGWKAVIGKDNKLLSNDYYVYNPKVGIYLLKEYQKNPFQTKGMGGKIARKIDEDIESQIIKNSGDFGILKGDYKKITKNLKKGIKPEKIFNQAIKGKKDLGLKIPVRGKASSSEKTFNNIKNEMSKNQKKIDTKFGEIATKDGLYKSYG